jgi:hypothetical protein
MNGSQAFYGFAALIIPVLLFGGAVTEQWKPQKKQPASQKLAGGVVVAMLFAIAAEVVAIDAAFTGSTSALGGAIVVGSSSSGQSRLPGL